MSKDKVNIIIPGPEEDAAINAGISGDPDTFELSDEWFARAKPSEEAVPHILERFRATRGKQKAATKEQIHIRLDADIIAWFKSHAQGERGYQTRINQALREYIAQNDRGANR